MENNLELQNQVELLYNAAAKPLYNLALYTTGDPASAEQTAIDAFVGAFHSIPDKTDLELFRNKSAKLLYRYICKAQKNNFDQAALLKISGDMNGKKQKNIMDMLCRLRLDERYILLLFCWQRFSPKQIARTICLPVFITRKRLYAALNKAVDKV